MSLCDENGQKLMLPTKAAAGQPPGDIVSKEGLEGPFRWNACRLGEMRACTQRSSDRIIPTSSLRRSLLCSANWSDRPSSISLQILKIHPGDHT
jgi:hypothetical protein